MVWVMMNLNNYAKRFGKRNTLISVLIDLNREITEDNVLVMKAETYFECTPETKAFSNWMLCPIRNRDHLEKLEELASIHNQVEEIRLQDKLGKQNFHGNMKKIYEQPIDKIRDTSRDISKTVKEKSIKNNKALESLNDKLLEILKDRGMIANYLRSPLSKITNREHNSQLKLVEDPNSNKVIDLLINKTRPFTFYNYLLTFLDTDKKFHLQWDLLKLITQKNYKVCIANIKVKRILYEFAKEMYFDEKALGKKSTGGKLLRRLLKSPAVMACVLFTRFSSSNPIELCDRIELLSQKEKAGYNSDIINEENNVISDKLLEYK